MAGWKEERFPEHFRRVRPLLSDFRQSMDNALRASHSGRVLTRNQVEALLSRIRAEARIHGYEIVLVGVRDGTAILMVTPSSAHPEGPGAVATTEPVAVSLDDHLHRVESDMIRWALRAARGNTSKAAALLRMKRSTLHDRMTRCGLRRRGER